MLSQDQIEALEEIANIGMGQAAASIARVLGQFIHISVPRIHILPVEEVSQALTSSVGGGRVTAVRQAFHSRMRGEVLAIFAENRCRDLAGLMGYEFDLDPAGEVEILLDISNILVGGFMAGIAEQLQSGIGFSAPSLMADRVPAAALLDSQHLPWRKALLVEVKFSLEQFSFASDLVVLLPDSEVQALAEALDVFLASL